MSSRVLDKEKGYTLKHEKLVVKGKGWKHNTEKNKQMSQIIIIPKEY